MKLLTWFAGCTILLGGRLLAQQVWDLQSEPATFTLYGSSDLRVYAWAAGDFNGDGREDIGTTSSIWPGRAGLAGSWDAPLRTPAFRPESANGWSAIAFGDLNADGIEDLIVGDPVRGVPAQQDGAVDVFFGRKDEPAYMRIETAPPDLEVRDGRGCSLLGWAVAAGDVTGDGIDDLVAVGPGTNEVPCKMAGFGHLVVVFGAPGLSGVIDDRTRFTDARIETGDGYESLAVGDVNGDRVADIVIGRPHDGYVPVNMWYGGVNVYYGGAALRGDLSLSPEVGIGGFDDSHLGTAVAVADANGDTVGDLLIVAGGGNGPAGSCGPRSNTGEVEVVYGGPSLPATIDLRITTPDATIYPPACGAGVGGIAAGDWDHDGIADVFMAAPGADGPSRPDSGEIYVVRGGLALSGSIDLASTPPLLKVTGTRAGERLGSFTLAAGDVTGDGLPAILAGSLRNGPAFNRSTGGSLYVLASPPLTRSFTLLRSENPASLSSHASPPAAPWDDSSAVLTDGKSYFYQLQESTGPPTTIYVTKRFATDTVRISWDDGIVGSFVPADPAKSEVHLSSACVRSDGTSEALVIVVPRDADGDLLGAGQSLSLEPTAISPGIVKGSFEHLSAGTYRTGIVSAAPASVPVVVSVDATTLAAQPLLQFSATAPSATVATAPPTPLLGSPVTFSPTVTGGSPPYSFHWDLDGNGSIQSTDPQPVFTYESSGYFAVSLRVTDSAGCEGYSTVRVPIPE